MSDDFDIEATLRASLSERARQVPDGDALAERIIADADRPRPAHEPRRARRWRGWALPVIAAGSVVAVVGAVVAVLQLSQSASHSASHRSTPAPTASLFMTSASPTPTPTRSSSAPASAGPPPPRAFRVTDLTFTSTVDGWALGSGECFKFPGKRCISIVRTSDGGRTWISVPTPPATVGGSCARCVQHIRFANDETGYAYGPSALFMTRDGGQNWKPLPGGADALETLHGNVIRVSDTCGGCAPGATYTVQIAGIGSGAWQTMSLPGAPVVGDSVTLSRTGSSAYLEIYQNPAGGAGRASATLLASPNDGKTWKREGEPCRHTSTGETDSVGMTTAADGSVTVVCVPRGSATSTVATSTDGGQTFTGPTGGMLPYSTAVGAASRDVLFRATGPGLYRSVDGGGNWRLVVEGQPQGSVTFLGFQSDTTGRWVAGDGSTIWTTTDVGRNWTPHTFR